MVIEAAKLMQKFEGIADFLGVVTSSGLLGHRPNILILLESALFIMRALP